MQRRNFIKQSSIAATALAVTPSLRAFAGPQETILGHNNKRYRIDTNWGKLDFSRYPVKDCHEMVQDGKGRIILLTNETKNQEDCVYNTMILLNIKYKKN